MVVADDDSPLAAVSAVSQEQPSGLRYPLVGALMAGTAAARRVKLIDELDEKPRTYILGMIEMAVTNKRLKDTLANALNLAC